MKNSRWKAAVFLRQKQRGSKETLRAAKGRSPHPPPSGNLPLKEKACSIRRARRPRRARGPPLGLCPPGHQVSPPVGAAALGGPRETDRPHNWGRSPHPSGLRPAPLPFLAFGHFPLTGGIGLLQGGREGQAPPLRNLRMLSYFGLGRRKLPGWAADSRPYRTYKRLSGEYRRGRSQTGPPSMGKFPGYGGRGTSQGGLSRPLADSPSAPPLRVSRKPSVFA